ncbi:MAG: bifunctional homocysteine S-methyltransferase/methylenetetrahydrofolate reductase [Actinomycetota bacterium]
MDGAALRTLLAERPLLADGGMGTSLIEQGERVGTCFELLNVDDPGRIVQIHRAFVHAGSDVVLTNTFGGNRFRLDAYGLAPRAGEFNRAAAALARDAGARFVAGSIGPLGVRLAPYGRVRPEDAFVAYREQAAALAEGGVDLLVVETQTDLREMEQALAAARAGAPGIAVVVSATFTKDDRTLLGSSPVQVAERLAELGADAIGANCGEGPAQLLRVMRGMRPAAGAVPLVARPNAGGPTQVGGRFVYPATPEYLAEHARAFLDEGVSIIGGCCGTGPAHTEAMAEALRGRVPLTRVVVAGDLDEPDDGPRPRATRTVLEFKLAHGDFVVAVEMEPPRSFDVGKLVAAAETLATVGTDVIDVADSPMAKMRMSAWAVCRLIQERGIETVLHFPTRGRNLLRLQGDLLGAAALGIRNLFVCVGDPVTIGDYPQGSNNVDVTATGLLALINQGFNEGRDRAGSSIGEPTSFFTGAAVAPTASNLERECRLLVRKVDAGARFLLSQPVYDVEPLRRLRTMFERVAGRPLDVPILAGVLPIHSARHAEFLHNEVPGVVIPERVRERLWTAGEDGWREGLAMAVDLIAELRAEGLAGIYLMPQLGRFDRAAELVEAIRSPIVGRSEPLGAGG